MTIRHLKVFIKVCELQSISKAAEELCVAQPSVSQTIKELEEYYNTCLFNRISKKLILTSEGVMLLAKAKEVVGSFDEFETLANNADLDPTIHIGASLTFGSKFIPVYFDCLKQNIPGINPSFTVDKVITLEERILHGDLDFAMIEGLPTSKSLKTLQIGKDTLKAVKGPNYDCPNKLKLADLIKYDLLLREPLSPARKILDYQLAIKGIKLGRPRAESIDNMVIVQMAINNYGIAIIPSKIAEKYLEEGSLQEVKLDCKLERKLFLISHKNKKFSTINKKAYSLCQKLFVEVTNNSLNL